MHRLSFLLILLLVACGQVAPQTIGTATAISSPVRVTAVPTSLADVHTPSALPSPPPTSSTIAVTSEPIAQPVATPAPVVTIVINAPLVSGSPLRVTTLEVGGQTLTVELASDPDQRQVGLMNRPSMAEDAGMLFVFPDDQPRSFWMRNTLIPLSIAFIDSGFTILNIEDMQALDDQTFHLSQGPARYALEVNQGWFTAHNVKAGDRVNVTLPTDLEIR